MLIRATLPMALPQAPRIPDESLSAPAHESVLCARMVWWGWARTRRWNESLPEFLTTYLLAQIRAASSASEESCSYSFETRWQQKGWLGGECGLVMRWEGDSLHSGCAHEVVDVGLLASL